MMNFRKMGFKVENVVSWMYSKNPVGGSHYKHGSKAEIQLTSQNTRKSQIPVIQDEEKNW